MSTQLSLTGKRWILPTDSNKANAKLLLASLLNERQLDGDCIPSVLQDMQKAVDRIRTAISNNEKVGIFGDYDCDGITAVAQLVRFFRRNNSLPFVRLPHRIQDGYGLNDDLVKEFVNEGVSLLITADTGVSSSSEIESLSKEGIETIVTDHHALPAKLPDAFAILHPELSSACSPPHPAGAGVVFQLLRALENDKWGDRDADAALAMIGTIADLVELRGANRLLVKEGLASLAHVHHDNPLHKLVEIAGLNIDNVTSTDIAFRIAPRINASGRIADPQLALQALLDGGDAIEQLNHLNKERQDQTETYVSDAVEIIGTQAANSSLLSVLKSEYPHGIIGLISGKLTEQFGKPSIVATIDDDVCTASLRSTEFYHITEGLTRCEDLLLRYGGHAQAAGCTLQRKNWEALISRLDEDVAKNTNPDELVPTLHIDAILNAEDVTMNFVEELSVLEPYGQGNREPLFLIENVLCSDIRCVGRDKSHLQCRIAGKKCIGFGLGKLLANCNEPVDIICRIGIDTWQDRAEPQLFIVDIRKK